MEHNLIEAVGRQAAAESGLRTILESKKNIMAKSFAYLDSKDKMHYTPSYLHDRLSAERQKKLVKLMKNKNIPKDLLKKYSKNPELIPLDNIYSGLGIGETIGSIYDEAIRPAVSTLYNDGKSLGKGIYSEAKNLLKYFFDKTPKSNVNTPTPTPTSNTSAPKPFKLVNKNKNNAINPAPNVQYTFNDSLDNNNVVISPLPYENKSNLKYSGEDNGYVSDKDVNISIMPQSGLEKSV